MKTLLQELREQSKKDNEQIIGINNQKGQSMHGVLKNVLMTIETRQYKKDEKQKSVFTGSEKVIVKIISDDILRLTLEDTREEIRQTKRSLI